MPCYISSNDNRLYAALEQEFGQAATVAAKNRIPAVKLGVRQTLETPSRRDKTGGRTYAGMPSGFRKRVSYDLTTYLTNWADSEAEPCYGPLFQAALGGLAISYAGGTVAAVPEPAKLTLATPHGLAVGQAIRVGGDIRFVSSIIDDLTVLLNAPFSETPVAGDKVGETVTYMPATSLPSVTVFDFWDPQEAVQRVLSGSAVDKMRLNLNGDFHQFRFTGESAELVDSAGFTAGQAGMTAYPPEPQVAEEQFSLVPGNLGQAWFGVEAAQFFTVMEAEVTLDNNLDLRRREFGLTRPGCIVAGQRSVGIDMLLVSNTRPETLQLYKAASERSPIGVMLQLGQQERQLCGIYMPTVIPEVPEFTDQETRLQWQFRNCRAQGSSNDEVIIAFA